MYHNTEGRLIVVMPPDVFIGRSSDNDPPGDYVHQAGGRILRLW